jgi:hypothetical protein
VLYVELVMSADRLVDAARVASIPTEGWPPVVVLGHVADVDEQVWRARLEQMLDAQAVAQEPPSFAWWEPDEAGTRARYGDTRLDDAAARLMAGRIALVTRLRELGEEQWDARASHDVFGELDVRGLLMQALAHDEEHRASLLFGGDEPPP